MSEQKCKNCRFWQKMYGGPKDDMGSDQLKSTDEPWGYCRRYPPMVLPEEDVYEENSQHPITLDWQWCGEWRPTSEEMSSAQPGLINDPAKSGITLPDEDAIRARIGAIAEERKLLRDLLGIVMILDDRQHHPRVPPSNPPGAS